MGGEGSGFCFVQDNTQQQQHTEMLRGAIDSTDGRISEIPRRYKRISNPDTEKACVCVCLGKQTGEMRKQK